MKSDDEWPWWCQLLWASFGSPWPAEIEDPDAFRAAIARQFVQRAGELAATIGPTRDTWPTFSGGRRDRRRGGQRHAAAPG